MPRSRQSQSPAAQLAITLTSTNGAGSVLVDIAARGAFGGPRTLRSWVLTADDPAALPDGVVDRVGAFLRAYTTRPLWEDPS